MKSLHVICVFGPPPLIKNLGYAYAREHYQVELLSKKTKRLHALSKFRPEKYPVDLRLPCQNFVLTRFESKRNLQSFVFPLWNHVLFIYQRTSFRYQLGCTDWFTEK